MEIHFGWNNRKSKSDVEIHFGWNNKKSKSDVEIHLIELITIIKVNNNK